MKPNFTSFKCCLLLLSVFSSLYSSAQDIEFAVLPFNRVGNLIYIEATVEDKSGAFLIDTGYRGVLLNKAHYRGRPSDLYLRGTNGAGGKLEYKCVDIEVALLEMRKVDVQVGDLSQLEQSIGIPLHGMIGSTFFEDFELTIDYAHNRLVLVRLDHYGEKLVDLPIINAATDTLALQFKGHLPVIEVNIGGRAFALGIDTGATSNLFSARSWSKLEDLVWGKRELYLRGLGRMRRKAKAAMLASIQVGGITFRSMQTLFSNIGHINRDLTGPNLDGIIGYEFLHQYTMGFNFRKKEMYLWQNEAIADYSTESFTAGNE